MEGFRTGSYLFPDEIGRTLTPEDFESLCMDVREKLFDRLPDTTWVYPGHGDDTTLGAERPHPGGWYELKW